MHQEEISRIIDVNGGRLLVITDLHGDGKAYDRCKALFSSLNEGGEVDRIVFCGDLIHRESPPEDDESIRILLDLKRWQATQPDRVLYLLGNHELAHIYRLDLHKGSYRYTPRLAKAMGTQRGEFIDYLATLPFFVRTSAGVAIAHAGVGELMLAPAGWHTLTTLDHLASWQKIADQLTPVARARLRQRVNRFYPRGYDHLIAEAWHVHDPADPFYDDILIGETLQNEPLGALLWDSFFTQNELAYGLAYEEMVGRFLELLSSGSQQQEWLITGHMPCQNGFAWVNSRQLRVASAAHARPRESGKVLLLDLDRKQYSKTALTASLQDLF